MRFFDLNNKWFVRPLFLFLFTYLVLRAYFVEPLFDELGTLYWYIQTGFLPGHGATLDANNHIINSILSHQCYRAFGDHFFAYRLFALSTFPLFFFAAKKLVQATIKKPYSVVVFLALVSVHWIFDYFGFTRGYGQSLAFLFCAFYNVHLWNKSVSNKRLALIFVFLVLSLLCNLSLFVPITLLVFYILLCFILRWNQQALRSKIAAASIILSYLLLMVPVYIYLNKLKKAGALWWGSTDGLWEVTGKSIAQNVLFDDSIAWKYIISAILLLVFLVFLFEWRKKRFVPFIHTIQFWIPGLLFLSLFAAVFMAEVMKVNYPMDRVGMYLIPLFILSLAVLFYDKKMLSLLLLSLLWFPASFVWKMNLDSSIFSPADRIHHEFYAGLKKELKHDDVLSLDYVSHASYAYLSRKEKVEHLAVEYTGDENAKGDYHISWFEALDWAGYRCLAIDGVSSTRIYKKNQRSKRTLLLDTIIDKITSGELKIPLLELDLSNIKTTVQTQVEATVVLKEGCLGLNLTHEILEAEDKSRLFQPTRFDWYFGHKTHYSFNFPNQPFALQPADKKLLVYMMNNDYKAVTLKKIRIRVYTTQGQ